MGWIEVGQGVAGWTTPVALLVAGGAAWYAKQASDHAKTAAGHANTAAVAANLQAEAANRLLSLELDRQREADAVARRAQANLISVWADYRNQRVVVRNSSDQLMYDVRLFVQVRGDLASSPVSIHDTLPPAPRVPPVVVSNTGNLRVHGDVLQPDNEIWWTPDNNDIVNGPAHSISTTMRDRAKWHPEQGDKPSLFVAVQFRDADLVVWRRTHERNLEVVEGPSSAGD